MPWPALRSPTTQTTTKSFRSANGVAARLYDDFTHGLEKPSEVLLQKARLVGFSIAERVRQESRHSTKASNMTLGRAVALKPDEVQAGINWLVKIGQVRVKHLDNGTRVITLELRPNIEPCVPTSVLALAPFFKTPAYHAFLTARARFLTKLFADPKLSPTDKVIAFAATRFIEPEKGIIEYPYKEIARLVGFGKPLVVRSIGRLAETGYFAKDRAPGKKAVLTPAMDDWYPGRYPDWFTLDHGNTDSTATSSPISVSPEDSEYTHQREGIDIDSESRDSVRELRPRTLDAAHGQWRTILPAFGIPPRALNGKHQPCPACGGTDRFRFTDRHGDGDYFCSVCKAGKGISLVAKANGWSYQEAAERIDEYIGNGPERKAA